MNAKWTDLRARTALRQIFDAAIASADPKLTIAGALPAKPKGRCIVVGAGKASAAMAAGLDAAWPDVDLSGVIVTRHGHSVPAGRIEVLEASHPVPDETSEAAAVRMLRAVDGLSADDLVIALISGGGSALMTLPAPPMTLADKQAVNRALLASGATITEMNVVRKHLSAIKGGRLALAARPARLTTLVISDVPGDDPAAIASGPTLPDPSTKADAQEIVRRFAIDLPEAARRVLTEADETPKPGEIDADVRLLAAPSLALAAAARAARDAGLTPIILGDALEGEAREFGTVMAGIARSVATQAQPGPAPAVLLSGGETTVTIGRGPAGRGGRNTEFLLALAVALSRTPDIWAIAGDSDGIDGTEDAAGALIGPDTLQRAAAEGLDARAFLAAHDSYTFFDRLGDLVRTGPTLTNVNDIRAVLIADGKPRTR
ncbi:glycerate kinase type-2 family protein [Bradyrhizobium ivorense]|uniref:glycerate kinase type-2 family protein n=1 Tax=Bradyrhizobium ivorense TaxID=2511166 RepID=UPI0010BB140D|nr:glycerate kinase [Bradyrhizobium ivorense]VIO71975.1 Putative hydroxypyruvate reductase [Bradyrhizobium ivorense]